MKRLPRHASRLGVMDFADQLGLEYNLPLNQIAETFSLADAMNSARADRQLMQGKRAERMFEYVVASLGKANLIKPEDGGGLLFDGNAVQPPDFFVSLKSGRKYYVEVKSAYHEDFHTPVTFSRAYLSRLKMYAELHGHPLLISVYWSNVRIWTISKVEDFETQNGTINLRFVEAYAKSVAGEFGDRMVAAVPPLICRVHADPARSSSVTAEGFASFTINALTFLSEDKEILDNREKQIAFYLMFHSNWVDDAPLAVMDGERVSYVEFAARSEDDREDPPGQPFRSLGTLAGMVTSFYKWLTTANEEIVRLTPQLEPADLAPGFDDGYRGKVLHLWQFQIEPNYEPIIRG